MNYYNEIDPKAAAWLRELITDGLIPKGEVDERSITDVSPGDLSGFTQCHFFAGIGGWAHALHLAGWPESRSVWTGSCPCQSFSCAGKGQGQDDPRHLWPHFYRLIRECRPECVFGEQVKAAIGFGWLDGVCGDLEKEGYAVGSHVLGAHSVGAPHIRQRLYWVAKSNGRGFNTGCGDQSEAPQSESGHGVTEQRSGVIGVADSQRTRRATTGSGPEINSGRESEPVQSSGGLAIPKHTIGRSLNVPGGNGRDGQDARRQETHGELGTCSEVHGVEVASSIGCGPLGTESAGQFGSAVANDVGTCRGMGEPETNGREVRAQLHGELRGTRLGQGCEPGFWSDAIYHPCRDGKARRISPESALFPLAHGLPGRVGLLRGAGNAIVPQVAAEFIKAYLSPASPNCCS